MSSPSSFLPRMEKSPQLEIIALTQKDMTRVNDSILAMAASHVDLIPKISNYLIESGGKRIRPMLTLAASKLCGYQGDAHIKLAACVEFMHTATLLHDDVVDESDMRRGKQSARLLWGNQASVLVGDFLLGQAFRKMVEVGSIEALEILANASAIIAEGEVLQLANAKNLATSEADYMAVVEAKTAALFSAATEIAPVIAGMDETARENFKAYGTCLGLAFQLVDDALDYGGNSTYLGKKTGDDMREGKITLPVIYAYARGTDQEKKFWQRCLVDAEITDHDIDTAIEILHKNNAITDTIAQAKIYGDKAKKMLGYYDDSPLKSAMLEVVDYCIARVN